VFDDAKLSVPLSQTAAKAGAEAIGVWFIVTFTVAVEVQPPVADVIVTV
jgi:hypothetical protein